MLKGESEADEVSREECSGGRESRSKASGVGDTRECLGDSRPCRFPRVEETIRKWADIKQEGQAGPSLRCLCRHVSDFGLDPVHAGVLMKVFQQRSDSRRVEVKVSKAGDGGAYWVATVRGKR